MSKIAERKATEAGFHIDPFGRAEYTANNVRQTYIDGYDQCLNDFKEFLYGRFCIHPHDCHVVQYVSDKPLNDIDDLAEEFEKYLEP